MKTDLLQANRFKLFITRKAYLKNSVAINVSTYLYMAPKVYASCPDKLLTEGFFTNLIFRQFEFCGF